MIVSIISKHLAVIVLCGSLSLTCVAAIVFWSAAAAAATSQSAQIQFRKLFHVAITFVYVPVRACLFLYLFIYSY